MLVEDDPDIQVIASIALVDIGGLTLGTYSSGREALAAAASFRPDLILLDVVMPDMDGPAVLSALRAREDVARIPVVFMTAQVRPVDVSRYTGLGCCGVIAKPFEPATLADALRGMWEHYAG